MTAAVFADALDTAAVWTAVVDGARQLLAALLVAGLVTAFSTVLLVALPAKTRQEATGGRVRLFEGAGGELEPPAPHAAPQARQRPWWAPTEQDAA